MDPCEVEECLFLMDISVIYLEYIWWYCSVICSPLVSKWVVLNRNCYSVTQFYPVSSFSFFFCFKAFSKRFFCLDIVQVFFLLIIFLFRNVVGILLPHSHTHIYIYIEVSLAHRGSSEYGQKLKCFILISFDSSHKTESMKNYFNYRDLIWQSYTVGNMREILRV